MYRFFTSALLSAFFFAAPHAQASWLYRCPATQHVQGAAGTAGAAVYAEDRQMRWTVSDRPLLPGCASRSLQLDSRHIQGIFPLSRLPSPAEEILLHGAISGGRPVLNSATIASPSPLPQRMPMPMHENLLPSMQVRSFGIEQRARAQLQNGVLQLECGSGARPAGAILSGPWWLPRGETVLEIAAAGEGLFEWQASDSERVRKESGLTMGRQAATGADKTVQMKWPPSLQRGAWRRMVIVCPAQRAVLRVSSLMLRAKTVQAPPRAAWVWKEQEWRQRGTPLLEWAKANGIGTLFVAVPVEEGAVREPAALAAFVRQAAALGVAVWAVDGDPHMVLPAEQTAAARRAQAYAAYNARAVQDERLTGVQFDVEPYLLPGYDASSRQGERDYLALAAKLRQATARMRLELALPFWWADRQELLSKLAPLVDGLTVMDYRTRAVELYRFGAPFLDWSAAYRKHVRIALEAGPVAAEASQRYARVPAGEAGDLLLVQIEGETVLLLLDRAMPLQGGAVFRLVNDTVSDPMATSFYRQREKLERLLPRLEQEFSTWSGFGGIALHEFR